MDHHIALLITSIFEGRISSRAHSNTWARVLIREGLASDEATFDSPLGKWLYAKALASAEDRLNWFYPPLLGCLGR